MPAWLDYQKLAAAIYADLSPGAVVTHDDQIIGTKSGIKRQIAMPTNDSGLLKVAD